MKSRLRRQRAVIQQLKRHGELSGPLSRAARRAMKFTKAVCPQCEQRVLPGKLTDHYIQKHPELIQKLGSDNREEG